VNQAKIYEFNGKDTHVETAVSPQYTENPESIRRIMRHMCNAVLKRYADEGGISDWAGVVTGFTDANGMLRMEMKMMEPVPAGRGRVAQEAA
jgi:hypothetical protein